MAAMTFHKLQELWPQLTPSAQDILTRLGVLLAEGHTGTLELRTRHGGVRVLREGQWKEYRPGDDVPRTTPPPP